MKKHIPLVILFFTAAVSLHSQNSVFAVQDDEKLILAITLEDHTVFLVPESPVQGYQDYTDTVMLVVDNSMYVFMFETIWDYFSPAFLETAETMDILYEYVKTKKIDIDSTGNYEVGDHPVVFGTDSDNIAVVWELTPLQEDAGYLKRVYMSFPVAEDVMFS